MSFGVFYRVVVRLFAQVSVSFSACFSAFPRVFEIFRISRVFSHVFLLYFRILDTPKRTGSEISSDKKVCGSSSSQLCGGVLRYTLFTIRRWRERNVRSVMSVNL